MKRNRLIQFKAAFLLLIFALNTIVGFACAMGVDMGFNSSSHHHDDEKAFVHIHADGKKHHHEDEDATDVSANINTDGEKHHHEDGEADDDSINVVTNADKHHNHDETGEKHHDENTGSKKDDCCNDKVVKLSQTDKAVLQSKVLINPIFFIAFISTYYSIDGLFVSQATVNKKYFVRGHHPPIPDIRIAIRSFQI